MLSFEDEFGDWLKPLVIGKYTETRDDNNDLVDTWETEYETAGFVETRTGTTAFEMDRRRFEHTHRVFLPFEDNYGNSMEISPDLLIVEDDPDGLKENEEPEGTRYRVVYSQSFLEYYQYALAEAVE